MCAVGQVWHQPCPVGTAFNARTYVCEFPDYGSKCIVATTPIEDPHEPLPDQTQTEADAREPGVRKEDQKEPPVAKGDEKEPAAKGSAKSVAAKNGAAKKSRPKTTTNRATAKKNTQKSSKNVPKKDL